MDRITSSYTADPRLIDKLDELRLPRYSTRGAAIEAAIRDFVKKLERENERAQ